MAIAVVSDWLELKLGDVAMETLRAFTGGAFEAGADWVEDARVAACGARRGVRSWRVGAECNWVFSLQKATEGAEFCFPWEHLLRYHHQVLVCQTHVYLHSLGSGRHTVDVVRVS